MTLITDFGHRAYEGMRAWRLLETFFLRAPMSNLPHKKQEAASSNVVDDLYHASRKG